MTEMTKPCCARSTPEASRNLAGGDIHRSPHQPDEPTRRARRKPGFDGCCPLPSCTHRDSGVALVVVLSMMALVVVIVIAFLSSTSTELRSAKTYAGGFQARSLADSAVNIVISQVTDATSDPKLAWASQPGMIRTYDNQGEASAAYKLYSSPELRVTGAFDPAGKLSEEVPNNWASQPSLFTDLNRPVRVDQRLQYPIIDPSAVGKDISGGSQLTGPLPPIEGCYLETANLATQSSPTQPNLVPMPVQWLYVLEDGTIAPIIASKVVRTNEDKANPAPNPIVGRIAFWADDESTKVNINTASEGTFWDRPWTRGPFEDNMNRSMPMQNEFQRFPGHPAMTSLSPVFPPLAGESIKDYNERIYGIIPRVAGGGSTSGTVINTQLSTSPAFSLPDTDRLFASVDEFLFNASSASRAANLKSPSDSFTEHDIGRTRFFLTANSRSPEVNQFNLPRITLWPLQIDPDPEDNSRTRTAKDKLIAACSTIGSNAYYFQRYNTYSFELNARAANTSNWANKQVVPPSSQSPTMDWSEITRNRDLFHYLQHLTSLDIPGLGGSLSSKYPNTGDQILVEMFDYVRSTVNPQRTLDNKVTPGADDIEYFYAPGYKRSNPAYLNVIGQQQVAPLVVEDPPGILRGKGFGRFPSIKQAVLIFHASDPSDFKTKSAGTVVDTALMNQSPMKMEAVLVLDAFNVTPGHPTFCPNVRYKVTWFDEFGVESPCKVNGTPIAFPKTAVNLVTARDTELNLTALGGIEYPFKYYEKPNSNDSDHSDLPKRLGIPTIGAVDEEQFYPFFTDPITVPGVASGTPTFQFEGGSLRIEIYPGYKPTMDPEDCVQTIHMAFPKTPITLNRPSIQATRASAADPWVAHNYTDFNKRLAAPGLEPGFSHNLKPLMLGTDTVRSVEALASGPANGDLRVFAALRDVPSTYFGVFTDPTFGYASTTQRAHGFRSYSYNLNGNNTTLYNGFRKARLGKLVQSVSYFDDAASEETFGNPIVPNDLISATMSNGDAGDWDTGVGTHVDGPFINKADMGNSGRFTSYFGSGNNAQTFMPNENGASYAPNRQIASAVSFGSLPTGINPTNPNNVAPWRTLLFGKHPAAGSSHPGFGTPVDPSQGSRPPYDTAPDHAYLDLFTMPVVEPYAISEPFSAAGKVNMNYQIAPFTYLTRDTGIRAVLKSTLITAIPTGDGLIYKQSTNTSNYRYAINPDAVAGTLKGFEARFDSGDIFRAASEICDISLVPGSSAGTSNPAPGSPTYETMQNWWNGYQLTGDNLREQPYGHIYPRLTTKSNTFTVHVHSQALKKAPNTDPDTFVENRDQVDGEFRGSFVIERYLDPNSDSLVLADGVTPAAETDEGAMVGPYKYRILSSKRF